MTRPVAALSSELLVRKGAARPLGLQPTEQTPSDVVQAVRPSLALVQPQADSAVPGRSAVRSRDALARLARAWRTLAMRWGLPTILFVAGLGMITVVAVTGPGAAPTAGISDIAAPVTRPPGPTPVTWVDNGLMANPALAGR